MSEKRDCDKKWGDCDKVRACYRLITVDVTMVYTIG